MYGTDKIYTSGLERSLEELDAKKRVMEMSEELHTYVSVCHSVS
jgi:hypothetical protein